MHLTEGRNTGFRKILNALKNNGSPEPLFETDENRTYFTTTLYIHPEFQRGQVHQSTTNDDGNDGNLDGNDGNLMMDSTTLAILDTLKENSSVTAAQIAARIGVSKPTVERHLKKLKTDGFIKREGSTRGKWVVLKR